MRICILSKYFRSIFHYLFLLYYSSLLFFGIVYMNSSQKKKYEDVELQSNIKYEIKCRICRK